MHKPSSLLNKLENEDLHTIQNEDLENQEGLDVP
jgi:hypothetical protein